jgi:hypothetical protein
VGWEPAEALDQLWRALDVEPLSNDAKLRRLCELLATPAWEAAPAALAEEAYAWLVEHRALARG